MRVIQFGKRSNELRFNEFRRGGGVAERARLESVYTLIAYRGFESLSLRHIHKKTGPSGLFFYGCGAEAGLEPIVRQYRQERY